jgi:UDPglucose 6-dehydrogenase
MLKQNPLNIAIVGTGYVGLVTGSCLAALGFKVRCFDIDTKKINALSSGKSAIYEPGLQEVIAAQIKLNNLQFTTDLADLITTSQTIFIAVGTPQDVSGKANLDFVNNAIAQLSEFLNPEQYKLIIIKSTVPIGTCRTIKQQLQQLNPQANFDIASNPEFLREGSAVHDFMHPDRIVCGIDKNSSQAKLILTNIYQKFLAQNIPLLFNSLESSELIKYAANCFLATKIAFVNELADLCESVNQSASGAKTDILQIANAMGLDPRIGSQFLQPGPGFGGSCFPKDIQALNYCAKQYNTQLNILQATINANQYRVQHLSKKIINIYQYNFPNQSINNKIITILGIAFKANTDDIRDSVAINVIQDLSQHGAKLQIYDPQAIEPGKSLFQSYSNIAWQDNAYSACEQSELIIILTEWPEFQQLDLTKIQQLSNQKNLIMIDFRNLFNPIDLEQTGIKYYSVGR